MYHFRRRYMKRIFFLVVGIFLLNLIANALYWYTAIAWFDMVMHTLGGIFLGFGVASFLFDRFRNKKDLSVFLIIAAIVLVVGLGWEGYEYLVQFLVKGVHLADIPDSISDLYCDITGGAIASLFVLFDKRRYNESNG